MIEVFLVNDIIIQLSTGGIIVPQIIVREILIQPTLLLCLAQGILALFLMNDHVYQNNFLGSKYDVYVTASGNGLWCNPLLLDHL